MSHRRNATTGLEIARDDWVYYCGPAKVAWRALIQNKCKTNRQTKWRMNGKLQGRTKSIFILLLLPANTYIYIYLHKIQVAKSRFLCVVILESERESVQRGQHMHIHLQEHIHIPKRHPAAQAAKHKSQRARCSSVTGASARVSQLATERHTIIKPDDTRTCTRTHTHWPPMRERKTIKRDDTKMTTHNDTQNANTDTNT